MALNIIKRASACIELLLIAAILLCGSFIALFNMLILRDRPSDLYSIDKVKERLFGKSMQILGPHCAEKEKDTSVPSLVSQASGAVLEIGPGIGNQIPRYDKSKVTQVYGVEPNPDFKDALERQIKAAGLTDEYTIVPHGIDDAKALEGFNIRPESIDTILDIQVLCSVPDPERAVRAMYGMLKPGGKWIVYEHVRSRDAVSRGVQNLFMILWPFVGGNCHLDRPMKTIIENVGEWESNDLRIEDDGYQLIPRVLGTLTKKR